MKMKTTIMLISDSELARLQLACSKKDQMEVESTFDAAV
jgi:hypothetical protein